MQIAIEAKETLVNKLSDMNRQIYIETGFCIGFRFGAKSLSKS